MHSEVWESLLQVNDFSCAQWEKKQPRVILLTRILSNTDFKIWRLFNTPNTRKSPNFEFTLTIQRDDAKYASKPPLVFFSKYTFPRPCWNWRRHPQEWTFFWLCWVFWAAFKLSLVAVSRVYSWMQRVGFSFRWLFSPRSTGLEHRLSSRSSWAQLLCGKANS